MQGAREHIDALKYMAEKELEGFRYLPNQKYIVNGHFIFELGQHTRGKTLRVFMVEVPPQRNDKFYSLFGLLSKSNSLAVYDAVSGQLGWDETYDFVVDGVIKEKLQTLFDVSEKLYQKQIIENKARELEEKAAAKKAREAKIKAFEKLLLNKETEATVSSSPQSTDEKRKVSDAPQQKTHKDTQTLGEAVRSFVCPYCGKTPFKGREIDGELKNQVVKIDLTDNEIELFCICPVCGKTVANKLQMQVKPISVRILPV